MILQRAFDRAFPLMGEGPLSEEGEMSNRKILLLYGGPNVPAAPAVTYDSRDQFSSGDLTSPRTMTPGPGTLTITDTLATEAISGGEVIPSAKTTGVRDPWHRETAGYARTIGRAFMARVKRVTISLTSPNNEPMVGWLTTLTTPTENNCYGVLLPIGTATGFLATTLGTFTVLLDLYGGPGIYSSIAVIMRNPGYLLVIDNKLAKVGNAGAQATLYPSIMARSANVEPGGFDDWRVVKLGDYTAAYGTQYGIATSRAASPTSGDTFVTLADTYIEFTWVPAGTETLNIMFRRTDDNNTLILRCDHSGGANNNTVKLIQVSGGSETELNSAAQTFTTSSTYRLEIIADTQSLKTAVNDVAKNTYTTASFNQTVAGGKITGHTNANGDLVAWPRAVPSLSTF